MRLVKAVGALALLMLLLIGAPAALHAWGRPLALLEVDWFSALLRPDDGTIVVGILSVLGWLAWAVVAVTTVSELLRVASRGAVAVRLPGTGWLRPAVASLVTALLAPLLGSSVPASSDGPPPLSVLAPRFAAADEPGDAPMEPELSDAQDVADGTWYVVRGGDELWTLAEDLLGSGHRWREIITANPGMSEQTHLVPGERIRVPASPQASKGAAGSTTVTVEQGDTLWDLSDEHLGSPHRWPELHEANSAQVIDPDHIDVGWELQLPHDPAINEPTATAESPAGDAAQDDGQGSRDPSSHTPPEVGLDGTSERTSASPDTPGESTGSAPERVHTPPPETRHGPDATGAAEVPVVDALGPIGAVLAAGIFAGVAARRRSQLLQRAVGRRVLPVTPELQRFWASLSRRASDAEAPPGMGPTGVVLGWDRDDGIVPHDLEAARCTLLTGTAEDTSGVVAAMVTSLSCAPWSTTAELVIVQPQHDWAGSLDDPRVRSVPSLEDGLADLQRLCASRRIQMGSASLEELRSQPDLSSAWFPVIHFFSEPLSERALQQVRDCLSLGHVGVSVVAITSAETNDALERATVRIASPESATVSPGGREFTPQLLSAPARRAVVDLFASATSNATSPAPWWDQDPLPPNVKVLPRKTTDPDKDSAMPARSADPLHPTLLLLGPVDLVGAAGTRPSRSVSAALESCAWLLSNPGATPSRMVRDLAIAEATRRSNVSRLRGWLGTDPHDEPYLPDAYTGHLELHPDVSSDWERFQMLLSGGVNHASDAVLTKALDLVRGEPLAGVSFQWPWADQLHSDMVSMVTDAAALLADRALERDDTETAAWAISRGRLAAGEDETLTVREIHLLALTGQGSRVDQVVRQLTRSARAAGRDLSPDSVQRVQHALNLVVAGRAAT